LVLSDLTASAPRLALVGLAKNTGKTVALTALLAELGAAGRTVGVTSVGRDGEERDVIDVRIEKPRVHLLAGSLVASTDALVRDSGLAHELLADTGVRTPLGRVAIVRLLAPGTIEVAGPSAAADVREVSDAMLSMGAEQVLIDGAIDRRAASSPDISDGLVISTGAVLSDEIADVVARTGDAVGLACLPGLDDEEETTRLRALAGTTALLDDGSTVELPDRFALTADAELLARTLDGAPGARWLTVAGAVPEPFLHDLARAVRRRGRRLTVVVGDSTRVFLAHEGPAWLAAHGVELRALRPISLRAITVNPVAPQSHRFDSAELRELLGERIQGVPIFDVLDPGYRGTPPPAS
jgi:hypothetical protein